MRFDFDPEKSRRLRANPQRGIGFEEVQALFEAEHIIDRRSDDPEQYRAIGWVGGTLYSLIFEVREDGHGEFYTSSRYGKQPGRKEPHMPKTLKKPIDAERLAEMADQGQDISSHFTNRFTVVRPAVQRVNVDFTAPMLKELDREAEALNISRQAVIKTMVREALDRRYLAQQARQTR